ncbi:hypothetical protein A4H97_31725 [Niastella yeongjuensis]|uniref:Beta-lactamase-inhibitor-like PepSY-like domain-containing protein n=1 Tax=Niastella yeongjuensis TaxID=354355 RepID=A0A1V9EJV0_9BACT|nr:hypothetical protein [Niastella yeongjuensis]OQP46145.1 hypothetical protein A4H97_31725 [Niastella yeongjuensis]SEP17963.1 hypothetical protein SAMN05660816_04626 [Niastella yeongjuensis]
MKKFIIIFSTLLLSFSLFARDPEEDLVKVFSASFPKAEHVHWYEMPKAWVVNFVTDGIRSRVVYLKDGKVTEFTRYYFEQNLPFVIRSKVKEAYPNKNIFGVIEVSIMTETGGSRLEYFIKLEDAKSWITVKSDNDGNLTTEEKYKKVQ